MSSLTLLCIPDTCPAFYHHSLDMFVIDTVLSAVLTDCTLVCSSWALLFFCGLMPKVELLCWSLTQMHLFSLTVHKTWSEENTVQVMSPQPITVLQQWPDFISLTHFLYGNPQILHKHCACADGSGRPTLFCVAWLVLTSMASRQSHQLDCFSVLGAVMLEQNTFLFQVFNFCTVQNLPVSFFYKSSCECLCGKTFGIPQMPSLWHLCHH